MKASHVRAAFDLVASLHFIGDQNSAAQTALAGLASLIQADRWTIYLFSEAKGPDAAPLEAIASFNPADEAISDQDDWRRLLLRDDNPPPGSESKAARLAGAGMGTIKKKERGQNFLAVPLICGERILGVLEGARERRSFTKSELELLNALSLPVASALANAVRIGEAERLSQTDDLTKLHNARYLRQFLLNEIRRARRYGSSVAALFLDLDDFKRVNDAHGHLAGSHVLMEMAAVILSSIRDTDAVARYGGDEFVIVLPDTEIELAGTDVGLVIPAVHIVVHSQARIPLRDLVERAVVSHPSTALGRDVESPRRLDVDGGARGERRGQVDAHGRPVNGMPGIGAGDAQRFEGQSAVEALAGEIEGGVEEDERRLVELVGDAVGRAEILLDEHP